MLGMEALFNGARRVAVLVGGSLLLLAGIVLLVLPGPGIPLIFAGLAVLGTQLPWARRIHEWLYARFRSAVSTLRARARRGPSSAAAPPSSSP
jgi:uncharacterized protein (TIGR02611 family)